MNSLSHKRLSVVILSTLIITSLILSGCGSPRATGKTDKPGPDNAPSDAKGADQASAGLRITLAGYSAGGSSSAIGEAIGGAINRNIPGTVFNYEPGQSGANEIKVSQGDTQLGLSSSLMVDAASKGNDPYKKEYKNLRAIAFLHTSDVQVIVDRRSGIRSIEDFKTKPVRISVDTKNSFMEIAVRAVLNAYGITYEDIEQRGGKVNFSSSTQALEQMRNRQLDARVNASPTPSSLFVDAATTMDLDSLPISEEVIEKVNKQIGTRTVTIPKKAYPFLKDDQQTVGIDNILIASTEMPDERAYAITKALYDNLDYLGTASSTLKKQMTKDSVAVVGRDVSLHSGSEKFYKDIGLLK